MEIHLQVLDSARNNLRNLLEGVSQEAMLAIPPGFNNNILWNIGHILSSHQALIYLRSGIPARVPDSLMANFRKGTSPAGWAPVPDASAVLEFLWSTPAQLREDLKGGAFLPYREYTTSFGLILTTLEDALSFANIHEALHFGVVSSLKKIVRRGPEPQHSPSAGG